MELMRTFLAVSVPPAIAWGIYKVRETLRNTGVRWVQPEKYHITVVFLGNRDPRSVNRIQSVIRPVMAETAAFNITFDAPDVFGSAKNPRVFIVKLRQGREELTALNAVLNAVLMPVIGEEGHPYRPHLTLGYPGKRNSRESGCLLLPSEGKYATIDGFRTQIDGFRVREVFLYQSKLQSGGASYVKLESYSLKEAQ